MKSFFLRRSLPMWAASALIPAVLVAAYSAAEPVVHAAPVPFDWWVECGEVIRHQPYVEAGTVVVVREFRGPEYEVDPDAGEFLADRAAAEAAANQAFATYVATAGLFYDLSCGPCEDPSKCHIWPIEYLPDGLAFELHVIDVPGGVDVVMELVEDLFVVAMCTDC